MSKIIQFNPNNIQPKQIHKQAPNLYCTCEFKDEILDDITISKPKKSKSRNCKTPQEIQTQGRQMYDSALITKNYLYRLIDKAYNKGFQDFEDREGNLITFEQDNLGRYVLIECDRDGNDKRRTTFTPSDGEIVSIESKNQKIVFFNYSDNYTEIRNTSKPNLFGNSTKETYCYSNHELISYLKFKQGLFVEDELVDNMGF